MFYPHKNKAVFKNLQPEIELPFVFIQREEVNLILIFTERIGKFRWQSGKTTI